MDRLTKQQRACPLLSEDQIRVMLGSIQGVTSPIKAVKSLLAELLFRMHRQHHDTVFDNLISNTDFLTYLEYRDLLTLQTTAFSMLSLLYCPSGFTTIGGYFKEKHERFDLFVFKNSPWKFYLSEVQRHADDYFSFNIDRVYPREYRFYNLTLSDDNVVRVTNRNTLCRPLGYDRFRQETGGLNLFWEQGHCYPDTFNLMCQLFSNEGSRPGWGKGFLLGLGGLFNDNASRCATRSLKQIDLTDARTSIFFCNVSIFSLMIPLPLKNQPHPLRHASHMEWHYLMSIAMTSLIIKIYQESIYPQLLATVVGDEIKLYHQCQSINQPSWFGKMEIGFVSHYVRSKIAKQFLRDSIVSPYRTCLGSLGEYPRIGLS